MKLIENMNLAELTSDIQKQEKIIKSAKSALDKIHGSTDYSDELAKHFHLGKVGFRKDAKRQNQTLDKAIKNGVQACEYYEKIDRAQGRLESLNKALTFIQKNAAEDEIESATCGLLQEREYKNSVITAKQLDWEKIKGRYGNAYKYRKFIVERIEPGFVSVINEDGELLSHFKTVKEAKAAVSRAYSKCRSEE